jgi:hypothetical protein
MLHLLTEASIFVPLPNECLCQVTGIGLGYPPPLPIDLANSALATPSPSEERKRKAEPHTEASSPKKRLQSTLRGLKWVLHTSRITSLK